MAIIAERSLFGWKEIEELGDLERLNLVLNNLPDERLMRVLEIHRDRGRNDFPIRPMWNSVLAGVVFSHISVASLRRELRRNGQLRDVCGFDVVKGLSAVPSSWNYSRFLKLLMAHQDLIEEMFCELVERCRRDIPDFGKVLMIDGKAVSSLARGKNEKKRDGRRDKDADWGVHEHSGVHKDGTCWKKVKRWFGYTLHLLVDAEYELPVGYKVTKASRNEMPVAHQILDEVEASHPGLLEAAEYLGGDRGYDDGKLIRRCWDRHGIKPVIDIRNCWQDGEESRLVAGQANVVYDYRGQVSCVFLHKDEQRTMAYGGFEKARGTLKYRCPASHYGYECESQQDCPVGKSVRIPLSEDRRIFTPLARSSYAWKGIYKKRTAAERVNSRLAGSYCLEKHFIRGMPKMRFRISLALCVMLAMAVGRVAENKHEQMRSLLKAG
jgi:hypothetical protein